MGNIVILLRRQKKKNFKKLKMRTIISKDKLFGTKNVMKSFLEPEMKKKTERKVQKKINIKLQKKTFRDEICKIKKIKINQLCY